ncbi:histone acetyltransferase, ELP3 family [Candidatus Methanoperedens nitroreducens]|uniref:tRNA carboxymethyluridine synthase n=1 Tax=Candidatus Methanoperedens nitratireducens TaxID=1392998 RepID=A0A062V5Y6_9EURY|nr:tRNA uridine(34) 5-carboxymethylaminomethyl modification radical SAM/GNAT enzyme Elp3 [Candidatus Methanoperedens nitroreducens]KCZ71973.1 histone acetyltransferase, ELP3 family [Candidatus Methanoperedens nitroreducens]MDJ1422050.1 tRNA uridine(34) 5-carboxymethylaminomethyl modification radical SAM/GNAT enzyme Elp3 [Candidatus Methanoperedens sp.]
MNTADFACRELLEQILLKKITNEQELNAAKKEVSVRFGLSSLPGNSSILAVANENEKQEVIELLQLKPVRTLSGVAVIAAMTSPAPCPHGLCVPCPGGPGSKFHSPQSYMGAEPAARRAFENNFDPYEQVSSRLRQLMQIGHPIEKAELIVMGGTFTSREPCYQEWFVKRTIEAMNDFYSTEWRKGRSTFSMEDVQSANESSRIRNVGITIETRPDWTEKRHIDTILDLGATKVEIGVQSTCDSVLSRMQRGHTVMESADANMRLRDSGLKVGFHMMPGLPGSTPESDLLMFRTLFEDERFKPDYLKIYPTLVTEGTALHRMWEQGDYAPLEVEEAVELLAKTKSILPKWVRLQRIQRDIPAYQVLAGVKKSNIRQLAKERLVKMGERCRCIRCREVGHAGIEPENIKLISEEYMACGGIEHFISFEDTEKDVLIGFIRLRFPNKPHRQELPGAALLRELHVYGSMVPPGLSAGYAQWQHRGYGEELLAQAEETAGYAGYDKIAVMSGIGVRDYYRKFGYEREGPYMTKKL